VSGAKKRAASRAAYDADKIAQQYPDIAEPTLAVDKTSGKEFLQKALSPEAEAVSLARKAAQKDIEGQPPQQVLKATPATADATDRGTAANVSPRGGAMGAGQAADAAPSVAEQPTLSLGTICGRLGFTISGAFLADTLHIRPAATDKRAQLYTESQYQAICRQLLAHVGAMAELYAAESVA
jgi:hypothetical protein